MDPEKHMPHSAIVTQPESEQGSSVVNAGTPALDQRIIRKLRLKVDLIILPTLAVTYTFNSLDRSNLGNAKTAGLAEDTNLKGDQYNLLLTFYYIVFVLFGPAMATFTKICSAKVAIPVMMLAFGVASAATASAKNFGGLAACRIIVGICKLLSDNFVLWNYFDFQKPSTHTVPTQADPGPQLSQVSWRQTESVVYYLSVWYTRSEIASRIAIFYSGSVIASAFGGLLAWATFQLTPAPGLFVWSYLFIIEGVATCVVAIATYFILPPDIRRAYFLSEAEKDVAEARIRIESMQNRNDKWVWSEAISEFKTVHGWARIVIGVAVGILPHTSANFLAIMTVRLGYGVAKTNLYTVAPAATAAIVLIILSYSSDYFHERGFHMTIPLVFSIIGYAILLAIDIETQRGLGYGAIFFCTIGAYPMSVIFSAWTVANIPNMNARAFTMGVMMACLNSMGLVASNIFFAREAPRYRTALIVNLAFPGIAIVLNVLYSLYLRALNRRMDKEEGRSTELADGQAGFRYQT